MITFIIGQTEKSRPCRFYLTIIFFAYLFNIAWYKTTLPNCFTILFILAYADYKNIKYFAQGYKNSYGIINSIEHITVPFNDTRTLLNQRLRASLPLITLADLSGNRGLLQRVQKVTSVVRFRSILFVSVFSLLSS